MRPTFTRAEYDELARNYGISVNYGQEPVLAMDAETQAGLGGTANAGVLAQFINWIDPQQIDYLFTPLKMAEVANETQKGDWTTLQMLWAINEPGGYVKSYGDFDQGGNVTANQTWEYREQFYYQTHLMVGDRDLAISQAGGIQLLDQLNKSNYLTFGKFQNASYIWGISGLMNYGMLNDPDLPAAEAASAEWSLTGTPNDMYQAFLGYFNTLYVQLGYNLSQDAHMTFVSSPEKITCLSVANEVMGKTAMELIKSTFPNMKFVGVPEYSSYNGMTYAQLIADEVNGVKTVELGFVDKMRMFNMVQDTSYFKQKRGAGTWGAIIKMPTAITTITGI